MKKLCLYCSVLLICIAQNLSAKSSIQTTIELLQEEITALRSQMNNLKQDTNLKLHRCDTEIESLKAENRKLIEQNKQNTKEFISEEISKILDEKLSKVTDILTENINHKLDKQNTKFDNVLEKVDNFIVSQEKFNKSIKQEKLDVIKSGKSDTKTIPNDKLSKI